MFFSMFYLIFYLNYVNLAVSNSTTARKFPAIRYNPIVTYGIYVLMIGLATYISLTRVSDYHHHPMDVLSGTVLGTLIAIAMSKYLVGPNFAARAN
jgi:membrane-associated phospholipid phosphatase